ncbi:MAG: DUF1343 domain-containing protein [Muribaculaceae bacterium]|nr:DUF1343 domain-containing protein [Muribaculaceae bacterium]
MKRFITFILLFSFVYVNAQVKCGADKIEEILNITTDKRVALIVNQTSVTENGTHIVDTLIARGVKIETIFAPEHGFRGNADAGESVKDGVDSKSGVKIISLYGKNKKPNAEQLSDIDLIVFDIQDVGARFYTYISTMYYAMQSATEFGKEFLVLDRPNPNDFVDGAMMDMNLKSFVGTLPLPIMHGLTVGELASMIKGENWGNTKSLNLKVIAVDGWRHGEKYELKIKPSPNLPNAKSIALYPSLCLFEGTTISVGRGTYYPFQMIGAPDKCLGKFSFTPTPLEGFDKNPLHKGQTCYGIDLREEKEPQGFSLKYLIEMYKNSSNKEKFFNSNNFFEKLSGDGQLRSDIINGKTEQEIKARWKEELDRYKKLRNRYLLYPDNRDL